MLFVFLNNKETTHDWVAREGTAGVLPAACEENAMLTEYNADGHADAHHPTHVVPLINRTVAATIVITARLYR